MKIPVVLSTVHVDIGPDGLLRVDRDGEPHRGDRKLERSDLTVILDEITTALGTAVRVEVRESDGTTYADIATPPHPVSPELPTPAPAAGPSIAGSGFHPGEEVELVYVIARQPADAEGNASITLPPALLAVTRDGLLLLGRTSGAVASVTGAT